MAGSLFSGCFVMVGAFVSDRDTFGGCVCWIRCFSANDSVMVVLFECLVLFVSD